MKKINVKQLRSYIFWGCMTSFINFSFYIGSLRILNLSASVSNIIAWLISVIFSFIANKIYVFTETSKKAGTVVEEFISFTVLRLLSGLMETALIYAIADVRGYNEIAAKLICSVFVVAVNYFTSKWIVFGRKKKV